VASANRTYADPSALLKLYIHEPASAAMSAWRSRTKGALPVTPHGRLEIVNGICLAGFRKIISAEALSDAIASFDEDLAEGRYVDADILWRATLRRARELSRASYARAREPCVMKGATARRRPSGGRCRHRSLSP
jgi:hypothetical protein